MRCLPLDCGIRDLIAQTIAQHAKIKVISTVLQSLCSCFKYCFDTVGWMIEKTLPVVPRGYDLEQQADEEH